MGAAQALDFARRPPLKLFHRGDRGLSENRTHKIILALNCFLRGHVILKEPRFAFLLWIRGRAGFRAWSSLTPRVPSGTVDPDSKGLRGIRQDAVFRISIVRSGGKKLRAVAQHPRCGRATL